MKKRRVVIEPAQKMPGKRACPLCVCPVEVYFSVDGPAGVEAGALIICGGCAEVLVFTESLALRAMTSEELAKVGEDFEAKRILDATRAGVRASVARRNN